MGLVYVEVGIQEFRSPRNWATPPMLTNPNVHHLQYTPTPTSHTRHLKCILVHPNVHHPQCTPLPMYTTPMYTTAHYVHHRPMYIHQCAPPPMYTIPNVHHPYMYPNVHNPKCALAQVVVTYTLSLCCNSRQ